MWEMELESKPDFNQAMQRIYAWYEQEMIDRPPVRFTRHNAEFEAADNIWKPEWRDLRDKWFDEEYQLEKFMTQVRGKHYNGRDLPRLLPQPRSRRLGRVLRVSPRVRGRHFLVAAHPHGLQPTPGAPVGRPVREEAGKPHALRARGLRRQVPGGLQRSARGHGLPGRAARHRISCCSTWWTTRMPRSPLLDQIADEFLAVFDHFDAMLKENRLPSVTWMGDPVVRQDAHPELRLRLHDLDQAVHAVPVGPEPPRNGAHDA